MTTDEVSVPYIQPRKNEKQIEIFERLELSARSGAHLIRIRVPVSLFIGFNEDIPGTRRIHLLAILAVAEEALKKCFLKAPRIAHSTLPAVSARPIWARTIKMDRTHLRTFKTQLCNALGVSEEG